jgi:hypothetical protein
MEPEMKPGDKKMDQPESELMSPPEMESSEPESLPGQEPKKTRLSELPLPEMELERLESAVSSEMDPESECQSLSLVVEQPEMETEPKSLLPEKPEMEPSLSSPGMEMEMGILLPHATSCGCGRVRVSH